MSAEGESSPKHAVVPTDAPGTASTVDTDTNKHILNSLNNNDQTMGQMAGLIAKFCEDGRPSGRKRLKRSADPPLMSPSQNMNITLAAQILKEHEKILHRTTI